MTDALVARDFEESVSRLIRIAHNHARWSYLPWDLDQHVPESEHPTTADEVDAARTEVLTAYATVQAERDAAVGGNLPLAAEIVRRAMETQELRKELVTLRETLVGEVEGMQRWDRVGPEDSFNDDWIIAHDSEGEYLYRSDVLRRIKGTP